MGNDTTVPKNAHDSTQGPTSSQLIEASTMKNAINLLGEMKSKTFMSCCNFSIAEIAQIETHKTRCRSHKSLE
jgi:hypothetical protein